MNQAARGPVLPNVIGSLAAFWTLQRLAAF
jgi:hypothetical protein